MEVKVIYDEALLSSRAKNLSMPFIGGQYLYFDPQLGENIALEIGVVFLIKPPGLNGDLLKIWDTENVLNTDNIIPIPREVSESGFELYCGFGTSVDQPNFRAYVIYSDVTQESISAQLETVQDDLNAILQNQTIAFKLDAAIGINQLAQNSAISILGVALSPYTLGVSAGVVPVLSSSSIPLLLP